MLRTIACLLALAPAPVFAQGFLDRIVSEVAPAAVTHDTTPTGLAQRGVFVYDARSDLANMALDSLGSGPHLLVLTHLSGGEAKAYIDTESGRICAQLAMSITRTHGGGWAYCHPHTAPSGAAPAPAPLSETP